MPDEYPVDGESLVRNLLKGIQVSEELGKVFNFGYTPFGWGQTAQLPQIYNGFGIDIAMVGKRVSPERAPQSEFVWASPDGSSVISTRFGEMGRQNFFLRLHLSLLFGRHYETNQWQYNRENDIGVYHRCDSEHMEQDFFRLDTSDRWHQELLTRELLESVWDTTNSSLLCADRLMMNGCDYSAGQKLMPELVEKLNRFDKGQFRLWKQSTMREYIEVLKRKLPKEKLKKIEGELRDGPAGLISGNALSTRLYIKTKNKKAQNLLIRQAEPLCFMASIDGYEYPNKFLEQAWDYLLLSHPHDSINGVTQDKTANDVDYRLNQVIDISDTLSNNAMKQIVKNLDLSSFDINDELIVVFNPYPYCRHEIMEAWVVTDRYIEDTEFWPPDDEGLQVYDAESNPCGTQWHGFEEVAYPVSEIHNRALPMYCYRHHIYFDSGILPACGYKVFKVVRSLNDADCKVPKKSRLLSSPSILKEVNILENDFIRVVINPNGTFDLQDKQNDKTYYGLNYYQDRSQIGDYWVNKAPLHEQIATTLGCNSRIYALDSGPLSATVAVEVILKLPSRALIAENKMSEQLKELKITTFINVRSNSNAVNIKVEFDNDIEDHTLTAMFPTHLSKADYAFSGGHFNVDKRPIETQGPSSNLKWADMTTLPQSNFVDISDDSSGLAVINNCLTEYEISNNPQRTIAITLLRSVKNWICTESRIGSIIPSQKGSQCIGRSVLEYSIIPHTGDCFKADIPLLATVFNAPVSSIQTRKKGGNFEELSKSYMSISNPNIIFSAVKRAENSPNFILRLYNCSEKHQSAVIDFGNPIKHIWQTNLKEQRESDISNDGKSIILVFEPKKILTIEIDR